MMDAGSQNPIPIKSLLDLAVISKQGFLLKITESFPMQETINILEKLKQGSFMLDKTQKYSKC